MWRAFFYATGIMLIILGIECIVVGRFRISPEASLTRVAKKIWGTAETEAPLEFRDQKNLVNGYGTNQSQFGPSKFSNDPFYNVSNGLGQKAGKPFNLPKHGSMATDNLGGSAKTITTEDWMPWSLIAAGAIISLYTQSLHRNQSES